MSSTTSLEPGTGNSSPAGEARKLMADLLHDLSQPLSTLTCLLEVNLLSPRPAKQSRHDLEVALRQVRCIVSLVRCVRALVEADNSEGGAEIVSLPECLSAVVAELRPLAESAQVGLSLVSTAACQVRFHGKRLRQAFFHLINFAIESSAPNEKVTVTATEKNEEARVTVAASELRFAEMDAAPGRSAAAAERRQRDLKRRLKLAMAEMIFERAGGSLQSSDGGRKLEACLPFRQGAK